MLNAIEVSQLSKHYRSRVAVVALDTPTALVAALGAERQLTFRLSVPLDLRLLEALPEVRRAEARGDELVVSGTGDLLGAVAALLAHQRVIAADLRVEEATLEEAVATLVRQREVS